MANNDQTIGSTAGLSANEEPATKHDVKEGGILGAIGGAVVGALAGGPVGAIIGAIAGGAASAAAVDVVDKHDHDYAGTGADTSKAEVHVPGYDSTLNQEPNYTAPTPVENNNYTTAVGTAAPSDSLIEANDQVVIPVVEEELQVGKREVQSGGARIHTQVIETPVEEQVTLHDETVTVNRHAVDRPVTAGDNTFRDESFEVTETAEVPVIAKVARVVEEVVVGKTATDRVETVHDTVRRTDVEVDEIDTNNRTNKPIV